MLRDEFHRWKELLASLNDEQITAPLVPDTLSIKDEVAHLYAWQQRSIARLEAVRLNRMPEYPRWAPDQDPDSEEETARINAWILESFRDHSWSSVHSDWHEGFLRFLELAEAIPAQDLYVAKKFPWLEGYAPAAVLEGSLEHHQEHREQLVDRLQQHEK